MNKYVIGIILIFLISLIYYSGCFEKNSDIEIIEYTVTGQKRIKEGCCYKNIIIDYGFNYCSDVRFYVVNGTILNKNNNTINKLKIIGNFYDIKGNKLISEWDHVSNLSYLSKKNFELIDGYETHDVFAGPGMNGKETYIRLRNAGLNIRWSKEKNTYHPWHPNTSLFFSFINRDPAISKNSIYG